MGVKTGAVGKNGVMLQPLPGFKSCKNKSYTPWRELQHCVLQHFVLQHCVLQQCVLQHYSLQQCVLQHCELTNSIQQCIVSVLI